MKPITLYVKSHIDTRETQDLFFMGDEDSDWVSLTWNEEDILIMIGDDEGTSENPNEKHIICKGNPFSTMYRLKFGTDKIIVSFEVDGKLHSKTIYSQKWSRMYDKIKDYRVVGCYQHPITGKKKHIFKGEIEVIE